jgi:hypothetical protein
MRKGEFPNCIDSVNACWVTANIWIILFNFVTNLDRAFIFVFQQRGGIDNDDV